MVKKMNKTEFIQELAKTIEYSIEDCNIINDILESNFFLSKKNKTIIITELTVKLGIDEMEATKIYEVAINIINKEVKYKLKHPFKSK